MIEIEQIRALCVHLIGDPGRTVPYDVDMGRGAQSRPNHTLQQLASRLLDTAFQRAVVHGCGASERMHLTDLGLLPPQLFALAPVCLGRVGLHYRDPPTIPLGDPGGSARPPGAQRISVVLLEDRLRMALGDAANRADRQLDPVMLLQLLGRLAKGAVPADFF